MTKQTINEKRVAEISEKYKSDIRPIEGLDFSSDEERGDEDRGWILPDGTYIDTSYTHHWLWVCEEFGTERTSTVEDFVPMTDLGTIRVSPSYGQVSFWYTKDPTEAQIQSMVAIARKSENEEVSIMHYGVEGAGCSAGNLAETIKNLSNS